MIMRGYRFWDVKRNCYAPDDDFRITYKGEWATRLCSKYAGYKGEDIIAEQSTGLSDKNGKEIYEGDIVVFYFDADIGILEDWDEDKSEYTKMVDVVDFVKGCFVFTSDIDLCTYAHRYNNVCEAVGNIHENPELLNAR